MEGLISTRYRALFGTGSKPQSDAMRSKGKRQPNRVLLSAEEEALIAGGAYLQAVQAYHEDASEPRRSGERPRNQNN
jgi:hypothetical protein